MKKLHRDGVALAYEEAGTGDPPFLLVHCWCCDHSFLAPQLAHFSKSHRVLSVDLRGHGESDKPVQDYTVAGFAHDLAWICGELGVERPIVVGHSMGGNTALELAMRHPDVPAAIVMIDSAILPTPPLREMLQQAGAALKGPDFRRVARDLALGI
jgi:pimeloyl-ACP methyl ester carboxylesterase